MEDVLREWSSCRLERLLTSVKKLSIARFILIPEDLLYGTRASGQSNSCVVSGIQTKTQKEEEEGRRIRKLQCIIFLLKVCGLEDALSVGQCGATVVSLLFCFLGYSSSTESFKADLWGLLLLELSACPPRVSGCHFLVHVVRCALCLINSENVEETRLNDTPVKLWRLSLGQPVTQTGGQ